LLNLMAGTYTVRIENTDGTRLRLDYISFDALPGSGIQQPFGTWGGIKALYR
jgi:hypothetical protein